MAFRITFNDNQLGRKLELRGKDLSARMDRAVKRVMRDAANEILKRGRADISSAGKFGRRWTQGLHADVGSGQQRSVVSGQFQNVEDRITVSHDIPYWTTHQFGATIHGKPLLWIPFSGSDAVGVRARDYPEPLFRVDRKVGSPLLFSSVDREPKYSGHESVRVPKRFHILEIARDVGRRIKGYLKERLRG